MTTVENPTTTGDRVSDRVLTTTDGFSIHHRQVSPADGIAPRARLLLLHGYGDHSGRYLHFMRWLAERGVESEAVDFRGHGRSQGRRGFVGKWEEYFQDLQAAADANSPSFGMPGEGGGRGLPPDAGTRHSPPSLTLPRRIEGGDRSSGPPLFMLGHSHGALVLAAAMIGGAIPNPRGVILCSPWFRNLTPVNAFWRTVAVACDWTVPWLKIRSGLRDGMMSRDPEMIADSHADPLLLHCATPRWFRSATAAQAKTIRLARSFVAPLLCLVAAADVVADPVAADAFAMATGSTDKSVHVVPGGRHELLRDIEREGTFELILQWMRDRS